MPGEGILDKTTAQGPQSQDPKTLTRQPAPAPEPPCRATGRTTSLPRSPSPLLLFFLFFFFNPILISLLGIV